MELKNERNYTFKNPNLNYKCLGGDLLVFKGLNDCLTINRGSTGIHYRIEGNSFTNDDLNYYLLLYPQTEAGKY
jgi:hypothetical protein